jgi:hypothetical protein
VTEPEAAGIDPAGGAGTGGGPIGTNEIRLKPVGGPRGGVLRTGRISTSAITAEEDAAVGKCGVMKPVDGVCGGGNVVEVGVSKVPDVSNAAEIAGVDAESGRGGGTVREADERLFLFASRGSRVFVITLRVVGKDGKAATEPGTSVII